MNTLWVCFTAPPRFDPGAAVLSFLSPLDEQELESRHHGMFVCARRASVEIRTEARAVYLSITTMLGRVRSDDGHTFREALTTDGEASRWWYHAVSFRDSESSSVYTWIVAVLTICHVADRLGAKHIVIVGASAPVVKTLRSRFSVTAIESSKPAPSLAIVMRGIAVRLRYLVTTLRHIFASRRLPSPPAARFDVMLAGFLDWSFWKEGTTPDITDRYFKKLPKELENRGLSRGWLAWLDPNAEPGKGRRTMTAVVSQARHAEVVLLQRFLRFTDLVKKISDFRPLISYVTSSRKRGFREVFQQRGIDFRPLFARDLLLGFANSQIPHCELVALATERACRMYRPRILLTFLEHFPHSRAQYEGVRRSSASTVTATMQHASYCHEKTFYYVAPRDEFAGEPENCKVPHPDAVFVMGSLGRELFLECGYEPEAVLATGSARYDGLRVQLPETDRAGGPIRVLMVSSLNIDAEMDMVEAVVAATEGLTGIELRLRNHPFRRIESHPRFARLADHVKIESVSLDDDLHASDVVLFTYSTVAEEAFLRGKPVWQWLPLGFNGSALAEVVAIPQFGRLSDLRKAFERFREKPTAWLPDAEKQQLVVERLFHRTEGSAEAIANAVASRLQGHP